MARGWESKAVADQIEAGNAESSAPKNEKDQSISREIADRLQSLTLSRSRLLQQLENATHPAHREILQRGLRAVEVELEALKNKDQVV